MRNRFAGHPRGNVRVPPSAVGGGMAPRRRMWVHHSPSRPLLRAVWEGTGPQLCELRLSSCSDGALLSRVRSGARPRRPATFRVPGGRTRPSTSPSASSPRAPPSKASASRSPSSSPTSRARWSCSPTATPRRRAALLDPVLERMMEAVHRYEGTVNQVMGDGIMALFGAPLAHEDHAVRACYAALRMQEARAAVRRGGARAHGASTSQIRVGLNSGEVVVRVDRQRPAHGLHRGRPDHPPGRAHGAAAPRPARSC